MNVYYYTTPLRKSQYQELGASFAIASNILCLSGYCRENCDAHDPSKRWCLVSRGLRSKYFSLVVKGHERREKPANIDILLVPPRQRYRGSQNARFLELEQYSQQFWARISCEWIPESNQSIITGKCNANHIAS